MSEIVRDQPQRVDIAIIGGGLAGGLIALAIHRLHPDLSLALIEGGGTLGGNHRWSWFESDLDDEGAALMACFPIGEWNSGHMVRFPSYHRVMAAGYRTLSSSDFDLALRKMLPAGSIITNRPVASITAEYLRFANDGAMKASTVIDCRSFLPSPFLSGGWQVFLGRHLRLAEPHNIPRPIIMDAAVTQHEGYRFVYSLPLSQHDIFVEDTYYIDTPRLDRHTLQGRIADYCHKHGWHGQMMGEESGSLPVLTGGDGAAHRQEMAVPGVVLAGVRGLFCHPLTGYSLPFAVANALAIARHARLPGGALAQLMEKKARLHWESTRFYRRLGRMLFGAAKPDERYHVFEHFYRLPEATIQRFYAGQPTVADKFRLLTGKPPVPLRRGMAALLGKGTPLVKEGAP